MKFLLGLEDIRVDSTCFRNNTPLHRAATNGWLATTELLIKAKANINAKNYEGRTPLHEAVRYPDVAHLLIKHGADIDAESNRGTPLVFAIDHGSLETVCMLLYYNADVNLLPSDMNMYDLPMIAVLKSRNIQIQETLLDYIADLNALDSDGMTLLEIAIRVSSPLVEKMVQRGSNVHYDNREEILLHASLKGCNINNFKVIWKEVKNSEFFFSYFRSRSAYIPEILDLQYLRFITDSYYFLPFDVDIRPYFKYCLKRLMKIKNKSSKEIIDWYQPMIKLMCLYCSQGFYLTDKDICALWNCFGPYNECFRLSLYMGIILKNQDIWSLPRIIYDTNLSTRYYIKKLSHLRTNIDDHVSLELEQTASYFRIAQDSDKVQSLLELSRNCFRDYLITESKHYFSLIDRLPIPVQIKNILIFKQPIYTGYSSERESNNQVLQP
ncbi:hypothetical protein ABEB36_013374 [Hypothenemus hampei]